LRPSIPVNEPLIGARELEYVQECLKSGWISSSGDFLTRFEDEWAAYCGRKYGIAVSSGTAALMVALKSLSLEKGDEVILPTFTIISCALAILYADAVPVLVDSDPATWTIDVNQIEKKITQKTRAILVVHIYGHPADMDPILELADRFHLKVIEDAAEAHGAEYFVDDETAKGWKRCGSFGNLSVFSFYANKLITTGEGGMILTDDPALAETARSLRNLYFQADRRFFHKEMGFNFRLTNLQAAIGLAQLERMEKIIEKKRWIGEQYNRLLSGIPDVTLPVESEWARSVYWMYGLVLSRNRNLDARQFAKLLAERGIETRPFFLGMHEQPVFKEKGLFIGESYPVAEYLASCGLYLPSGLALTEEQLKTVSQSVREILCQ
jgi:perosamine synthetase